MSGERLGSAGAWLAVGALVLSAHVAAAAWAMRQPGQALPAAPDAILLDLAPPPAGEPALASMASHEAAETEALPEPEPAPEPEPEQVPEFTTPEVEQLIPPDFGAPVPPEPVPEFEPPPVVPMPPPDFASLTSPAEAAPAIVPPPPRRPERLVRREEPREKPREEPRRETRREREQPRAERREESQASRQGHQGRSGDQGARQAPAAASGGSRQAQASWEQRAGATVSKHMSRTRVRGQRGVVQATVTVSVSANGATSAQLARGTGDPDVDAALSRQAARMPSLPPPPSGRSFQFTQPIAIRLR